jgi:hypothetical protein
VEEVDADASRITTLKSELETLCTRFGVVKKIIVYDVIFSSF